MNAPTSLSTRPPLTLRGVTFDPPLFCAPMANITHSAFRRLVADFGGYGALFTEMLSAKQVRHENPHTSPWLKRRPRENRVIYQLLVTEVGGLAESIERLAPLRPDGIDLNCACAAPNVRRFGGGAALFEDAARLRAVVRVMRQCVSGPLTVKIRLGRPCDSWRETLRERLRLFEGEGVDAVTVQPRFADEARGRRVRHELYGELSAGTRLPIIANGEIDGADFVAARAPRFAGVAGFMIGRMAAARPWLFAQWRHAALVVEHADVWDRLCEYIAEDFDARRALMRLQILTPYLARNFVFGHVLSTAIRSAPDYAAARARGAEFLAASPALLRHVTAWP